MKKTLLILFLFLGTLFLTGCDVGYTPDDYNNRGVYKFQNGDHEGAIVDFKKAFTKSVEQGYSETLSEMYLDNWIKAVEDGSYEKITNSMFDF